MTAKQFGCAERLWEMRCELHHIRKLLPGNLREVSREWDLHLQPEPPWKQSCQCSDSSTGSDGTGRGFLSCYELQTHAGNLCWGPNVRATFLGSCCASASSCWPCFTHGRSGFRNSYNETRHSSSFTNATGEGAARADRTYCQTFPCMACPTLCIRSCNYGVQNLFSIREGNPCIIHFV